ncbi:MAG: tagaturonate epimerase family protein, partial [Pirellula sp.]|nr:tagaturonate epimerase family protein [Pirellula sp.]
HVDADHIGLATVDRFIPYSDFYTIDVADFIGKPADETDLDAFLKQCQSLVGEHDFAGLSSPFQLTVDVLHSIAAKYLSAIQEAGRVYRHISAIKGDNSMIVEVSMDETDKPQTPVELFVILAALAAEKIPVQTIAPKFTGRFNKGVDYVGNLDQFEQEFRDDLAVVAQGVKQFGLPETLKLSIHSGSDKFKLYPIVSKALAETGAGIHVKTAGTTWLEEVIGLSEAGGDGLILVKEIYEYALSHIDEFCAPYASVIDIDRALLPAAESVSKWSGSELAQAIRHDQSNPLFNASMRQLLHVSFKVAAKQGARYTDLLKANADIVGKHVCNNIYERHLKPLFIE